VGDTSDRDAITFAREEAMISTEVPAGCYQRMSRSWPRRPSYKRSCGPGGVTRRDMTKPEDDQEVDSDSGGYVVGRPPEDASEEEIRVWARDFARRALGHPPAKR
jgi:hypothetical protein